VGDKGYSILLFQTNLMQPQEAVGEEHKALLRAQADYQPLAEAGADLIRFLKFRNPAIPCMRII
jgi:hypothetical protein